MKRLLLIWIILLLAIACTTATETAVSPATQADTAVSQPTTAPPPVITVETPRVEPPTAVPEPTIEPAVEEAPAIEPEPLVEEVVAEVGVVSGRTVEGAFFLGDPNAPITHIDYSDFL